MPKNSENGDKNQPDAATFVFDGASAPNTFQTVISPQGSQFQSPQAGDLIMPGSFNPLHDGHLAMADAAARKKNKPCWFELSVPNADKNTLAATEVAKRAQQNFGNHGLVISHAAAFVEKSALFPGALFVVGADTILRIGELKYYGSSRQNFEQAISEIKNNGCQFLVFGRKIDNIFIGKQNIKLAENLIELCDFVDRSEFENNSSSTKLRNNRNL